MKLLKAEIYPNKINQDGNVREFMETKTGKILITKATEHSDIQLKFLLNRQEALCLISNLNACINEAEKAGFSLE